MAEVMPSKYGVVGNPIHHSKSPIIHRKFAEQCGISMTYDPFLVGCDDFRDFIAQFFTKGGKGLNVTLPFKEFAHEIVTERTVRAKRAGAVNTLIWKNQRLIGDNTDGIGFIRDLTGNYGIDLTDKRVLLLGAGGAARGLIAPLFEAKIRELVIANRTYERARQLGQQFSDLGTIKAVNFNHLPTGFDLIVNSTSASLHSSLPPLPKQIFRPETVLYDLMYGKTTEFMEFGQKCEVNAIFDGLGMLVEQAAAAFEQWHGVWPETASVLHSLRNQLQSA